MSISRGENRAVMSTKTVRYLEYLVVLGAADYNSSKA